MSVILTEDQDLLAKFQIEEYLPTNFVVFVGKIVKNPNHGNIRQNLTDFDRSEGTIIGDLLAESL